MKMNAGTWIAIVTSVIGVAISFISVSASSSGELIPILIVIALTGSMFLFFYKILIRPALNAIRLKKTGLPGTARILSVKDTGVSINNNPVVSMEVEVKDQFGARYNTILRALVSRIDPRAYQPGMEVAIKIDPQKKENIILDEDSKPTGIAEQPANKKTELNSEETATILSTGRSARAIVRSCNLLGSNGHELDIALELEVLPEMYPAFSGHTRIMITEEDLHKYQPGAEVKVKYDLYEKEKIVIDPD